MFLYRHTLKMVIFAIIAYLTQGQTFAQLRLFDDKSEFLSQTCASPATMIPTDPPHWYSINVGFTSGELSFTLVPGESVRFATDDWSPRLPGNELGLSGLESFNIDIDTGPVLSFGFDFVEPEFDPFVNGTFIESAFRVTLKNGATTVGTFDFERPNDSAEFVGVWVGPSAAFDRVEIREITGGNENELFGQFYTGTEVLSNLEIGINSSDPAEGLLIGGTLQEQVDIVNGGPPSAGYGPVNRHIDFHFPSSFDCTAGDGAITDVMDDIEILNQPPTDVNNGELTSNQYIRVFMESVRVLTDADADVDTTLPGMYHLNNLPTVGIIPAGTHVSSHLFHFDTTSDQQPAILAGTVSFESDILGVIVGGDFLNWTDDGDINNGPFLGSTTTSYPVDSRREWELIENGFFTIAGNRRSIEVQARVEGFLDQMRVVTAASPEDILAEPYVSANEFIVGADEVTLDNCSSAWYRFTFQLPNTFRNPSLHGFANVDDAAVVYLNGNQISAAVNVNDLGVDRVDDDGRPLLGWPTTDSFSTCQRVHFVPGTNEIVFGVVGDLSQFDPTGLEFEAIVKYDKVVRRVTTQSNPQRVDW